MKARIPPRPLTNKQRRACAEVVKDLLEKQEFGRTHRTYKVFCYVLNRRFGFSKNRLNVMINEITELLKESETDEVFWEHLDRVIINEIGMDFKPEKLTIDGHFIDDWKPN